MGSMFSQYATLIRLQIEFQSVNDTVSDPVFNGKTIGHGSCDGLPSKLMMGFGVNQTVIHANHIARTVKRELQTEVHSKFLPGLVKGCDPFGSDFARGNDLELASPRKLCQSGRQSVS